nr:immunoglobulin heavy chain junction region [Mus musculus]NSM05434.1 immunoglobulin heavy chain junction region [Mus musculus]NSM05670.1 immunoglobulin heavy chain junction region [Mus musculus]
CARGGFDGYYLSYW